MHLTRAFLCNECDEIHESTSRCPRCGDSTQPFRIARVIKPKNPMSDDALAGVPVDKSEEQSKASLRALAIESPHGDLQS